MAGSHLNQEKHISGELLAQLVSSPVAGRASEVNFRVQKRLSYGETGFPLNLVDVGRGANNQILAFKWLDFNH